MNDQKTYRDVINELREALERIEGVLLRIDSNRMQRIADEVDEGLYDVQLARALLDRI